MARISIFFFAAALLVIPGTALAHESETAEVSNGSLVWSWEWDPFVLVPLGLSLLLYLAGTANVWTHAGRGRAVGEKAVISFVAGWLILFLALVSPIHTLGQFLFSVHMTQHELLMLAAAPLLVLGTPLIPFIWALPKPLRALFGRVSRLRTIRSLWKFITFPLAAWVIHAAVLWIWHLPALFEATLHNRFVHGFQHVCFLFSALLFWWAVLENNPKRGGYGAGILYLFTTSLHSGLLGALLTFSRGIWYPAYAVRAPLGGMTALEDQRLGGLIMWIPAASIYLFAALILFTKWLADSDGERAGGRRPAFAVSIFVFALAFSREARADDRLIYVSNERDGTISVISSANDEVVDTIALEGRVRGIRISPDGAKLYAAVSTKLGPAPQKPLAKVVAITLADRKVGREYAVGPDPEQLALGVDGKRMYVSNEDGGTASIVDIETGKILAQPVVGMEPEGAVPSPDGKLVYITGESSNSISVIDTASNDVRATFLVGARPRDAVFSHDSARAYSTAENGGTISVIDVAKDAVVSELSLGAGLKPAGIVITPDDSTLFIACGRGNAVVEVDCKTLKVTGRIPVGQRDWGLALVPENQKLYVANGLSNDVSVIDISKKEVTKTIKAGDGPWGVAVGR